MSDEELFLHHLGEAEKAFKRLKERYKDVKARSEDNWISTKKAAADYLGISRATFYRNFMNRGLKWSNRGVKKSQLDNFQPEY